jgi:hypothetical protein
MVTYFNLPSGQRKTQQIADQFNAAEERWRSLEVRRLHRRERYPEISPELHIQLDLLNHASLQTSQDCVGSSSSLNLL